MSEEPVRTAEISGPQPPARHVWRTVLIVGAVAALLGISLAFAPVRSFAAQILSVFRVQKIATISLTGEDLERMSQALERGDGHISLDQLGEVWVDGRSSLGESQLATTTLEAAEAEVGFPILIPEGVDGTQTVMVDPGSTVKFKLNVDKVNELLRYYGAEKLFSDSLDGKTFEVKIPPTVYVGYGTGEVGYTSTEEVSASGASMEVSNEIDPMSQSVFIAQSRGPELAVPDGVNPAEIRDVLLGLPFLPEDVKRQLAGVADWQHTLIVPSIEGSTRAISVASHDGVVIGEPKDPDMPADPEFASPFVVMWQQDGILRAVVTTSEARSLQLAESMAR